MKKLFQCLLAVSASLLSWEANATSCITTPACILSQWPADSSTTDIYGARNGTLQNGATYAAGKICDAFSLDGSNDYVSVPDSAALRFTSAMTIEAWVKPDTIHSVANEVISKWGTVVGSQAYTLGINASGYPYFLVSKNGLPSAGNIAAAQSPVAIGAGVWNHILATYDGTNLKIYINGGLQDTVAFTAGIHPGTNSLIIGSSLAANSYFDGLIDNPGVYNCALTDEEIVLSYEAQRQAGCYTCVEPEDCIVSWWTGNATGQDLIGGNHGVLTNGASYAPGLICDAFNFDGTNDYVFVSDSPSLRFTTAMTAEAWVYPTVNNKINEIISKWKTANHVSYTFSINAAGHLYFIVSSNGNANSPNSRVILDADNVIPANIWSHVAATYDGTNLKLYINGQLEETLAYSGGIHADTDPLYIGTSTATSSFFSGMIDEPAVYGCALTQPQLQAIYEARRAGKCHP